MPERISRRVCLTMISLLAIAGTPAAGTAAEHCCCIADGYTRSMWARTWYAQNSVMLPVNPYFVPRSPGNCRDGTYYTSGGSATGIAGGEPNHFGAYPYAPGAAVGFEPLQPERLGKVPNEMAVGNSMQPMPGGSPVAVPLPRR